MGRGIENRTEATGSREGGLGMKAEQTEKLSNPEPVAEIMKEFHHHRDALIKGKKSSSQR